MNKDILTEMQEISPSVAKLCGKKPELNVDPSYWQESEERWLRLQKLVSHEGADSSKNDLPSKYWENLEDKIMSKRSSTIIKPIWWKNAKVLRVMAASFVVVMLGFWFLIGNDRAKHVSVAFQQPLSQDEIWQYIEQNPEEFTLDQLAEAKLIDTTMLSSLNYIDRLDVESETFLESEIQF
jgi:hypothetical protein